ncbi:MAG: hypothetical protein RQ745_05095 [Longimicrobiales bacterium]|nr:hypothetical protein [Longimicrobiales bacterium]
MTIRILAACPEGRNRGTAGLLMPLVLLVLFVAPAEGQRVFSGNDSCTWEACALRVEDRFFGAPRILQGAEGRRVATTGGLFPPRLPLFAERSDTAAVLYARSRVAQRRSSILDLIGGIVILVAGSVAADDGDFDEATGVTFLAGIGLTTGGSFFESRGRDYLSQAVWWYNGTLPGRPVDGRQDSR